MRRKDGLDHGSVVATYAFDDGFDAASAKVTVQTRYVNQRGVAVVQQMRLWCQRMV